MQDFSSPDPATDVDSKVLVLYTGGTIGMLVGANQSFTPEPHFLVESLRSQNRFHDPLGDSLFSHSSTAAGFRAWTHHGAGGSGRSSPLASPNPASPAAESPAVPTLLVRSSRPIALPPDRASGGGSYFNQYTSRKVSDDCYEMLLPSLVTPRSLDTQGNWKRIRYAVLEWEPLLDSSNMDIADWIRIATEIELNYHLFDAFVVLHGTDTMCYSSSALSFLLEDLGKTVILTGAQIPLSQLRNDAVDNFLGALWVAGHYIIPEVSLYFNHVLYRGNRCSKTSSFALNAFESPNFPPLVNVGIDVVVNWSNVLRQTSLRKFHVHKSMASNVATLRLFPGITGDIVRAFLNPPIRGVVLETFGAGNAPQREDLMDALRDACERGVVIVAISQCSKGAVSAAYETGQTLLQAGVVAGGDMTPESALAKLAYLLSKTELTVQDVRKLMGTSLRGELTPSTGDRPPTLTNAETVQDILSHITRVSSVSSPFPSSTSRPVLPPITITLNVPESKTKEVTATWGSTASETVSTEAALAPFLIHLAAARDDADAISFCLNVEANAGAGINTGRHAIAGGMVNCLDPASGRTPLHSAALNGSLRCVNVLLEAGALVHMRDGMDHSPLYYAARQGHEAVVDVLVQAGALLGGSDIRGGFVALALGKARRMGDSAALRIWSKAGADASQHD